jgi:hypothetical protein
MASTYFELSCLRRLLAERSLESLVLIRMEWVAREVWEIWLAEFFEDIKGPLTSYSEDPTRGFVWIETFEDPRERRWKCAV